ncbi:MAG: hypothetical protein D6737_15530 [Chloroflexi bacterium]|nr:MAG: hypothetical protein D6737_15530 [Chloroflexota bacterium]
MDNKTTLRLRNKTGKTWEEWYNLLDTYGESNLQAIIEYLMRNYELDPHWAQLIGMRYRHRRSLS